MEEIEWWVGVDWASEKHRVCLLAGDGRVIAEREVTHDGAGLTELCDWLEELTGASPAKIAVAIETTRGPVVEALLARGFPVYALNPKQLDRFRDRFSVAGAKDDSRDAHVLGDSLRTDRRAFRRLTVGDPQIIELREWSRLREDLQQERTRLTNRMREQLWRYFPQMLKLTDDLGAEWFLALWHRIPTPAKAASLRKSAIDGFLQAHRIHRLDGAEVLGILRQKPLVVAPGTTEASCSHIRILAARLRLINAQLREAERRLDELCDKLEQAEESEPGQSCEQRDVAILRSLPGLGRIILATLLAEAWEPLQRRDYHALRSLCGVAPVTRCSGKIRFVIRRLACDRRLAQALYHWARVAAQHDPTCKRRYHELRQRGHSHGRALRTIGDRLLAVACAMLQNRSLFDPAHATQSAVAA